MSSSALLMTVAVAACAMVAPVSGKTRTYYIAAVEEDWDYAPNGNLVNDDTATSDLYLKNGPDRIGSVYLKAMLREFTDDSFTERVPREPYLGILGPHLRAEEGDTVVVVFRNLAFISGRNFSVHPHGLQYEKNTEGALYVDSTSGVLKRDDGVPPGQTYTYIWDLPASFANTKDDDPCLPWAYHSHTFPLPDVDTGLVGLLTTCKKGTLTGPQDRRRDVQAEYPVWVETNDESASWLYQENLKKCGDPDLCRQLASVPVPEDGLTPFQESNLKQHVNGLMYGNLQGLTAVARSQPVAFYFFSLSRDIKSIFVSGQIFSVRGQSKYAVQVYPATFVGSTMTPVYSGTWLLTSKVTEAYTGGQQAFFNVAEDNGQNTDNRYPSHTDNSYPSHTDNSYPRTTTNSYPKTTSNSYSKTTDNSYPKTTSSSYPKTTSNSYPKTTDNSYQRNLDHIYPRYTDDFDFDFDLGSTASIYQRPSSNNYFRPTAKSFQRPTISDYTRSASSSYPTHSAGSYPTRSAGSFPRSSSSNYRGKRSADFMNIERAYSSNPEAHAGSSHDHVQGDGMMAYQAPRPAPEWDGSPYWTQGDYSGTQNYKGVESADRHFYLDVEDYVWDYAPSGQDLYFGGSLTDPSGKAYGYFSQDQNRIGGRYLKTRYVRYSDGTFSTAVARGAAEEHLGMLGPVLQMEAGETVAVTLRNSASRPYSFFPHGLLFSKDQEGFVYKNPDTGRLEGRAVVPGEKVTYHFLVPPLDNSDNPCVANIYQSALDAVRDLNTGLVGPLLVCQRGQLPAASSPYDRPYGSGKGDKSYGGSGYTPASSWFRQHKHFYLNFFTVDENLSWHLRHNIDTYAPYPGSVNVSDPGFVGSNRRYAINGLSYGNLKGLDVCRGQNVAWHLFGVGDRTSVHGANFHGQALDLLGNHLNARVVIPGVCFTLTSTPETLGQWSVACRTNFHFQAGMVAKYQVSDCPGVYFQAPRLSGVVREYFIAAEEVYHDYAPVPIDSITGESLYDPSLDGFIFVRNDTGFIGKVYKKARYIRYTDARFSYPYPLGPEEEHLGLLGPVVTAEVGDRLRVTFYNKASRSYSIHPQGVQYDKKSEGALYQDGAAPTQGDEVQPGDAFTYEWTVPPSSGPGPSDPACTGTMYYSSVDSVKDVYSGLIGPLLLCRQGTLVTYGQNGKLRRRDVDKAFWQLYSIVDENESWYLEENTRQFAPERFNMPGGLSNPQFVTSNQYHSINGKIYANVRGMVMDVGDVVAWYLLGYGSAMDFHPVHYHGQTFILQAAKKVHRGDVMEVFPSTSETMTMLCDNPGEWLVHCHFQSHAVEGMEGTYTIRPRPSYAG